jgi:hypothetical protein
MEFSFGRSECAIAADQWISIGMALSHLRRYGTQDGALTDGGKVLHGRISHSVDSVDSIDSSSALGWLQADSRAHKEEGIPAIYMGVSANIALNKWKKKPLLEYCVYHS